MTDELKDRVIIKNIDGTEIEVAAKVECKHTFGFWWDFACSGLAKTKDELKTGDDYTEFRYCPDCGKKLIED
jgi:hypothetical protein